MLLQDKSINLLGITVPTGDGWRNEEIAHMLKLLQIARRADVPAITRMRLESRSTCDSIRRPPRSYSNSPGTGLSRYRSTPRVPR